MYTMADFGKELKEKVIRGVAIAEIGHWALVIYHEHIMEIDFEYRYIFITLNSMENGPEFEMSYKRLDEIADDLIDGKKDINLDY